MATAISDEDRQGYCTALRIVGDIYTEIIKEMIRNKWPPKDVLILIKRENQSHIFNRMNTKEQKNILEMDRHGYNGLDFCLMYKVIRNFGLLSSPKQGWGGNPKPDDQRKADDVERMRKLRNYISHRPSCCLSESKRNSFFKESIEIAERMDSRIGSPTNGFKSKLQVILSGSLSSVSNEKLLQRCPKYQDKFQESAEMPCSTLYYGNDIEEKIGAQEDQSIANKKKVTIAIIKPDAVGAGNVDRIIKDIKEAGMIILQSREKKLTELEVKNLYSHLQDQELKELIQFMTSGPSYVLVLTKGKTGEHIVEDFRDLIGPDDVIEAKTQKPESLRAKYGQQSIRNALHGSSSLEIATREFALFFPDSVMPTVEDKVENYQTTLALLRPEAFRLRRGDILTKICESGFNVAMEKEIHLTREEAEEFYREQQGQEYFEQFITNLSSGPVLALCLARENAIEGWRSMLGPKEVSIAKDEAPESLRAQFAVDGAINSIHGSDSEETAKKELQFFFSSENLEEAVAVGKADADRKKGDKSSPYIFYLNDPNIDVNDVLQNEDNIKESLCTGNDGRKSCVELTHIEPGSIILHVTIPDRCFNTKEILHKTIQSFLRQFFIAAAIQCRSEHIFTVVLAESDDLIADNESANRDYLDDDTVKPSPALKLYVNVKDSVFQNEFVLYREVNRFITGMYNATERDVPMNGSAREVLMLTANTNDENFASSSEAIQDIQLSEQSMISYKGCGKKMAQEPIVSSLESNYFKISTLLLKIAPRAVRIKFDDVFPSEELRYTLSLNKTKLTDLKINRCINQVQWNSMFPGTGDPTSQLFDSTLMICLFKNLKGINISNQIPPPMDFSIGADMSRIKIYRKDIAYFKGTAYTNQKFTGYWNEAKSAIIRLGGEILQGECDKLKAKVYDVSDRKNTHHIVQSWKGLAQTEYRNEVVDRIEKISSKQNFEEKQDCFEKVIEEWEEENKWFVPTNAFNFIRMNLDQKVLAVVGNPGIGKSMLLHQIAIHLRDTEGYSIFLCHSPSDIVDNCRKETKQVFIFDDVCGQFTLVQSHVDQWNKYEIRIERILQSKTSIMLVACRSQVFRVKQCSNLFIFSKYLCNLNSGDYATDSQQKLKIADQYLSQKTISEIKPGLDNFDMFPLLCKLYKSRESWNAKGFFKNPYNFYREELDSFYTEGGETKCCALFLCVLHNGCLNQTILVGQSQSDFSQTLKTIFEKFRLNQSMSYQIILDSLEILLNTYLEKRNGQFYVLHNRLFDFLCYYFGQHEQQLIINYADSEIIRDRTVFKSLEIKHKKYQNYSILIDPEYENEYMERLVNDMLSGYIDDVLYNHQLCYEDFRLKLLAHLQKLDDDDVTVTRVLGELVFDENEKTSQLLPVNFACKYGYRELFEFFLSKTKDVNAYEGNNIPLITACRKGDTYMTGLLLEKGANVNQTDSLGCSPLLWSCVYGNLDIVQMLLHNKADIENIEVCSMSSPLIWACFGEFIRICESADLSKKVSNSAQANEIILVAVENINDQFSSHEHLIEFLLTMLRDGHLKGCTFGEENLLLNKKTPELTSAVKTLLEIINGDEKEIYDDISNRSEKNNSTNPFIEIMNVFLERGVDIDKTSTGGITALFVACMFSTYKRGQSISYLLSKGASVNKSEIDGKCPLHVAVHRIDLMNTLVKSGSSVNCEDAGGNTPLMMAVNLGLEKNVLILIKEGAVVNTSNSEYVTPLMKAVHKQNIPIVNILIKHDADINIRFRNGSTLLHHAIQFNNADLINTLIKTGISVNCEDGREDTPLMMAVDHGLEEICVILIKKGANVNTWNYNKMTPLMLAVVEQNISIVNILIEHKAHINVRFRNGSTLLHRAIEFNNADLINTLIKTGISVNCDDGQGNTPLMVAAYHSLANIAGILIKEGAKVNTCNTNGTSLLMIAASNGDVAIVKMILTKIVKFDNYQTVGPLFSACNNNHQEVVRLLLQTNCDLNIPRTNGNTCLFEASDKGLETMVYLLIEQGAKVNASNFDGDTPLTVASMKGHTAIVRLLIAGKANMYKSNKNGESALILAGLHNHLEIVKVLIESGCNIESLEKKTKQTCLSVACYHAYDKIVTYLIEQGSNVNTQSNIRNTPLMLAASKGHLNIVKILIEHKSDVNIPNEKGSTSLSLASSKGFEQIVTCLIKHGADVNTKNCIGTTPLILAASKGHLHIVNKLIENKADVNSQNDKGSTCLSVASSKGFDNIVTYILDQEASIDTANSNGDSPLMLASKNGHLPTVKILLENGAKVDMKNKEGLSSLDLARKSKHAEIADVLCECIQSTSE